ncbi:MAG: 3-phosphoshikimate 1-carboxyvinyltransferase [Bacteroidaceae bacterium]|nr:3-phosphoshikimate 1-carboxyvinyltransferase [Bacteroidaceae bacterium]
MEKRVYGTLKGEVTPPPSKSQAHRLLICAALAVEPCSIVCNSVNDDIMATMRCLNALGADITYTSGLFDVKPISLVKGGTLDCGESGSTLRFLMSVAAVLGADATFTGAGKLPQRPMGALTDVLAAHGMGFVRHSADELPVTCNGTLRGGEFSLPGNISSQYLTGLLFALPLAAEDSTIEVTGGLTSASYIDMTIDALRVAGISVERRGNIFRIKGGQQYRMPARVVVEGDWSSAAFWVVAGVIGKHPLTICGMNNESLQGDSAIIDHLRGMGAFISIEDDKVIAMPSQLFGTELDCMDTPDLVPILSVAAAVAQGTTVFTNVGRLRFKESDRLAAMKSVLSAFGIDSAVGEDTFTVYGGEPVAKATVDSFGDHRIAMSAAVLSSVASGVTVIEGSGCVAKSYPSFFEDFAMLGGKAELCE